MSFGHRHRTATTLNGHEKNIVQKKETTDVLKITADGISEEAVITVQEEEKKPEPKKRAKTDNKKIIVNEVKKEEIKKPSTKKVYEDNTGVVGQNLICREFRAIIKKKGLKINEVLNKMLHEWNTANYNL